jgi:hypothetical protein
VALPRDAILGRLMSASPFEIDLAQREAWMAEIEILKPALKDFAGHVYLEFDVPRLGSRIDAVLISGPAIIPIEFKVGQSTYERADHDQAWDYGLDLKNFHRASHEAPIFPLLVATRARRSDSEWPPAHADGVRPPRHCSAEALPAVLHEALSLARGSPLDAVAWGRAPYHPTPTIVQAARALYARHSVRAISRSDAGARNLAITGGCIEGVIQAARRERRKAIVFVTGVPGAGKTLAGLDLATRNRDEASPGHAVYLSGNGPLVAVLREAIVRDELARRKSAGERKVRKGSVAQKVKPFIQNVHHWRDEALRDPSRPPHDHVVIFDEAQRAWNQRKLASFMKRRKGRDGFSQSEPHVLIGAMDRQPEWAVVVCLVGGGQEIHDGEAGIGAWLDAVRDHFPAWRVHLSSQLGDSEYAAREAIRDLQRRAMVRFEDDLHLSVSLRSFRSENVSRFIKATLDGDVATARGLLAGMSQRYPVALTRDLPAARRWIRKHARGTERYGLVVSSSAERLKPHAIDVRVAVDPVPWFLNDAADTRSSWYLEDAATEFQVQGLELDWTCVSWDADLRRTPTGWSQHSFRGHGWTNVKQDDRRRYLLNAYRVLLTRARQGMVIFVPPGDDSDPTRRPAYYDGTFEYLAGLGVPVVA